MKIHPKTIKAYKVALENIDIVVDTIFLTVYFIKLITFKNMNDIGSIHIALFFGFWFILFNIHMQRFKTMTGPNSPGYWKGRLEGFVEGTEPIMNAAQIAQANKTLANVKSGIRVGGHNPHNLPPDDDDEEDNS